MNNYRSIQDFRCRMYLPKDLEREYFIPDPTILFHGDFGALIRSPQEYPETELYNVLKISCYPDPPDYHIARFKDWIRFVDPNLFPDCALKEAIKERTYFYLKDRDSIVKSYCKQNHLKLSSFPRPVLTSKQEQKFGNCGPEKVWIDKADRWFRQIDIPLAWSIRLAMIMLLIMLLVFLNLSPVAPFGDQLIILAFTLLIGIAPIEITTEYFTCKFILRRARQEPFIWPMDLIDLHWLLRELSDFSGSSALEIK